MEPTPTPENGRQSRGLARFWPVHGMPVPGQRQSDEEPGARGDGGPAGSAGPDAAVQQNGDSAAQPTDGPPTGHPGAQQMNGFIQSGSQGSVAPGPGFSSAAAAGQGRNGPGFPGQNAAGQNPASQNAASQNAASQNAAGQNVPGQGVIGQGFPRQADRQDGPRERAGFGSATQAQPALTSDTQMVALGSRRGVFGDAQGDDPVGEQPSVNGVLRGWTGDQPGYAPADNDRTLPGHRNGDAPRHGSVPGSGPVDTVAVPVPNRLPPAVSPAVEATGTFPVRPVSSGGSPVPPASSAAPTGPSAGAPLQQAPLQQAPRQAASPQAAPQQAAPAPVMSASPLPVSSLPVPVPMPHPANGGPIGLRSGEPPAAEPRAAETRAAEPRTAETRAGDGRAAETRAGDGRAAETRAGDGRAAEARAAALLTADPATDPAGQGGPAGRGVASDPADLPRWAGTAAGGADHPDRSPGSGAGRRSRDGDEYHPRSDDSAAVTRRANTPDDAQTIPADRAAAGQQQDEAAEQRLRPGDVVQTRITLWDDEATSQFHNEWHEVKAQFVDDPVAALTRAHDLLTEAVHELTESLLAERDDLDPLRRTSTPDTESMRMAMRGYREFLDRILAL
jgi:hypothetical protein